MKNKNFSNYFLQERENLPIKFKKERRLFDLTVKLANGDKKFYPINGWNKPENQKTLAEINAGKTFGVNVADLFFFDFDHIFNADGFINKIVEDFVNNLQATFPNIYIEYSVTRTGLHCFFKPTKGLFGKITNAEENILFFDKKLNAKLEIFYLNASKFCFCTGFKYGDGNSIPQGKEVDEYLKTVLEQVQKQHHSNILPTKKPSKGLSAVNPNTFSDADKKYMLYPKAYLIDLAVATLDYIDPSPLNLADANWLSVISSCKNIGVPENIIDQWNLRAPENYDEKENLSRYNSLHDPNFFMSNLIGKAVKNGFNEYDFEFQWFKTHTQFKKPIFDNNDFDIIKENGEMTEKLSKDKKFELFCLPISDFDNAERLKNFCGRDVKFLTDSSRWLTYQQNLWKDGGRDNAAILPYALNLSKLIQGNAEKNNSTEQKLSRNWKMRKTFSNSIEILKGFESIRITEQDLNTHKNLLCCQNGVVDLQTGKLYPHDPKLLSTQCVNAEYRAGYRNDRVEKFLHGVLPDEETLNALLRFLGYSLTGSIKEEKALFIHGTGGNGKGTLSKTLLALFGDYACSFPIEEILISKKLKDADAATPNFAKLQWRRLAISEEIPESRKLDYAKFKILTGGDPLPIRKLFQEASEIKDPVHKMIFSGNNLPELTNTHDNGILRRWIQIRFEQDFNGANCDTSLKEFLQTPDALSALLNILIDNAVAWYKDGLIISEKMKCDRENYFAENDFLAEFINSFCERNPSKSVLLKEFVPKLKSEYPSHADLTPNTISQMLSRLSYLKKKHSMYGIVFYGIGWRDPQELDFDGEPIADEDIPF